MAGLWGLGGGASVDDSYATIHFSGGGAQLSAGAGFVDVSNLLNAPLDASGSSSFTAGDQTGFSVRLLSFQVDLYFTNPDTGDTFADVEVLANDIAGWTDQAFVDSEEWFEVAGDDAGTWTVGAVDTVGDAFDACLTRSRAGSEYDRPATSAANQRDRRRPGVHACSLSGEVLINKVPG